VTQKDNVGVDKTIIAEELSSSNSKIDLSYDSSLKKKLDCHSEIFSVAISYVFKSNNCSKELFPSLINVDISRSTSNFPVHHYIDDSNEGIINKNTEEHNSIYETIQIGKGGLRKSQKSNERNSK